MFVEYVSRSERNTCGLACAANPNVIATSQSFPSPFCLMCASDLQDLCKTPGCLQVLYTGVDVTLLRFVCAL